MLRDRLTTLLALAALLATGPAAAQSASAPLVLRLPSSARALAMGDAFVAGLGSEVIFYNPARLGVSPGLGASVERLGSASTAGAASANLALGSGGVGVGVQMLDYGAASGAFPAGLGGLTTRGPLLGTSTAVSLGMAYPFKGVRFGATAKYAREAVDSVRGGVAAADVGAAKGVGPVTVGVVAQNLGGRLRVGSARAELPRAITAGFWGGGLPVGPFDLTAGGAVSLLRGGRVAPAAGLDVGYVPLDGYTIAGRAGVRRGAPGEPTAWSVGAGFALDRVSLDYAYETVAGPGGGHRVGLRIR